MRGRRQLARRWRRPVARGAWLSSRGGVGGWARRLVVMPLSLYCSSPVHLPPAMSQLPLYLQVLGFPLDQLVKWAFTTPVQFWCGLRFHRGAITALRNGGPSGLPPPASCHPHFPPAPPHAVLSPAYVLCHRPSVFGYAPPALVHADMLGYPQLSTRPRPLAPPPPRPPSIRPCQHGRPGVPGHLRRLRLLSHLHRPPPLCPPPCHRQLPAHRLL